MLSACVQEVEDIFYKYGKITRISIKPGEAGGLPAFCFVEYGHADEAYDAVKALDGREKLGKRLRVRISTSPAASSHTPRSNSP